MKAKLKVEILPQEITVRFVNTNVEVFHWTEEEWTEDPSIAPTIANAINLAYINPDGLVRLCKEHIDSQLGA